MNKLKKVALLALIVPFIGAQAQDSLAADTLIYEKDGVRIIVEAENLEEMKRNGELEAILERIKAVQDTALAHPEFELDFRVFEDSIWQNGFKYNFEGDMDTWAEDMEKWGERMEEWGMQLEKLAENDYKVREKTDSLGNKKIVITMDGLEYEYPAEPNENWFEMKLDVPAPPAPPAPPSLRGERPQDYDKPHSQGHNHFFDDDDEDEQPVRKFGQTYDLFEIRFGFSNYLNNNNQLPRESTDNHALNTLRSNIFTFGSSFSTRLAGPVFIKYGLELSFADYFLEGDYTIQADASGTNFIPVDENEVRSLKKSKLKTTHITAPIMLLLNSGDPEDEDEFTLGLGGYFGYLIGSKYKMKYEDVDGDNQKVRKKGSFNLNELQYGVQAQLGVKGVNLFARYALSEMFDAGTGPELNGISFGIVF